ncbi:hypothetical protein [Methylopila sp. 73B]|uniref:hypothetical protein n=1 Tax=Methylopila sp. 73B TaxID=1120792 RepID=UPI000360E604|nr:hypothetical protein [Methylopila sp. 73B]
MTRSELIGLAEREVQRLTDENDHSAASIMGELIARLRTVDEYALSQVQRMQLQPGDIIALTMPRPMPANAVAAMRAALDGPPLNLKERGVAVMVLDQDAKVTVLGNGKGLGLKSMAPARDGILTPNVGGEAGREATFDEAMKVGRQVMQRCRGALAALAKA